MPKYAMFVERAGGMPRRSPDEIRASAAKALAAAVERDRSAAAPQLNPIDIGYTVLNLEPKDPKLDKQHGGELQAYGEMLEAGYMSHVDTSETEVQRAFAAYHPSSHPANEFSQAA